MDASKNLLVAFLEPSWGLPSGGREPRPRRRLHGPPARGQEARPRGRLVVGGATRRLVPLRHRPRVGCGQRRSARLDAHGAALRHRAARLRAHRLVARRLCSLPPGERGRAPLPLHAAPRRGRYIFALNAMQLNLFPYVLGLTGPVGALRTTGEGGPPRAQPSPPPRRVVATGRRCAGRRSPRARPSAGRRCGGARAAHGAGRG